MGDLFGARGTVFLDGLPLPAGYAVRLRALWEATGALDRQLARLDAEISAPLADDQGYRAIQTIGGIGPILATVFVTEIGDVTCFPVSGIRAPGPGSARATASPT